MKVTNKIFAVQYKTKIKQFSNIMHGESLPPSPGRLLIYIQVL